jgi:anti-anti-sigma factor
MPDQAPDCILTIDIERKPDVALVRLHGRLIAEVSGNFYTRIRQLMNDHKHIVLDLTDLVHMDNMGLGSLVRLVVSARSNGCTL